MMTSLTAEYLLGTMYQNADTTKPLTFLSMKPTLGLEGTTMSKAVYKYGTGEGVPEGAIYLTTVVEDSMMQRFVWHYFLVVEESKP